MVLKSKVFGVHFCRGVLVYFCVFSVGLHCALLLHCNIMLSFLVPVAGLLPAASCGQEKLSSVSEGRRQLPHDGRCDCALQHGGARRGEDQL